MPVQFDHEKLHVYQASIKFVSWMEKIPVQIPKRYAVYDQLDRASTSIPLNIAEGYGKNTPRDRCRFFDIAHGSSLECAAAFDVLVARAIVKESDVEPGKEMLLVFLKKLTARDGKARRGSLRISPEID